MHVHAYVNFIAPRDFQFRAFISYCNVIVILWISVSAHYRHTIVGTHLMVDIVILHDEGYTSNHKINNVQLETHFL